MKSGFLTNAQFLQHTRQLCKENSYFTHAKILNHIHAKQHSYAGALKLNRKVVFEGREDKLQEVAGQIPPGDKKAVRVGKRCYWYFT